MKLFSVISWILLSITSLISPFVPSINKYADFKIFWLTLSGQTDGSTSYFPLIIYYGLFYFTFILLITSILASCVVMVFFIFKNPQSLSGMFGQYSKYHFIPILCTTALYITGEASDFTLIFPNHATFIFGLYVHFGWSCFFNFDIHKNRIFIQIRTLCYKASNIWMFNTFITL